jgi:3-oxoacyl-[acyl-carrier-protein] synthase II
MTRRVVITGVGAVTPLGAGATTLHERWTAGECGIEDGQGRCDDFDPTAFLSRKEARRADRFTQLAIAACDEAVHDAAWHDGLPYEADRVATVIGTGIGGLGSLEDQHDVLRDRGRQNVSPLAVPLMMGNAGAAALAMRHGLHGEAYGVVSACAAGAQAIGSAARMISTGEATAALAGGAEAALTPLATAAFAAMDATSNSGICRPFDARRDGFVMGEGAGVLVLEERVAAEERGAKILAEVCGYGASADAHHLTAPEPEGRGAAIAIERALEDAHLEPKDIDYVNAHGTSTPLNDRAETAALKKALGDRAAEVPVSSTKSAIGHLLGAAGAVEAIATVLALRDEVAPPTLGHEQPDEGLDLDYVPGAARPLQLNGQQRVHALSDAFGFGGHNAVLCLGVDR